MSANAACYIGYTRKLVECKFVASGAINGHSRHIMWLKWSNNNLGNNDYYLLKEDINEFIIPLQVRGDKGSGNRFIAKKMVMVSKTQCRGYIVSRLEQSTRIEHFFGENTT